MAETLANIGAIQELSQQLKSKFAKVGSTIYGQMVYRDPSSMTVGGHYSQTKESDFNGSEQILYSLGQAKKKAASSPSLVKYHFDTDIEAIISNFKEANEAIADIGSFLMNLTELYQQTEAKLIAKLGDFGGIPNEDRIWVEDTLDPIGGYTDTRRGLLFAAVGLADWSSLLATGEDGIYGVDACLIDATTSKTTRNEDGERVTEVAGAKILCFTYKFGGGKTPDGEAYGFDMGVNFMSYGYGKKKDTPSGVAAVGLGDGWSTIRTVKDDGTSDTSYAFPLIPVSGTLHNWNLEPRHANTEQ